MKTKALFLFLLFFICVNIHAQKTKKKIDGTIYICDSITKKIENKSNIIAMMNFVDTCHLSFKERTPIIDLFKKIFSKERTFELSNSRIGVVLYCDGSGRVLEVVFLLSDSYYLISLSEIKKMEDNLKTYQFQVSGCCPNEKYDRLVYGIPIGTLYSN